MHEPTTQDIDALIGASNTAPGLPDPRAGRARRRRTAGDASRPLACAAQRLAALDASRHATSRAEAVGDPSAPQPRVTTRTLRQHAVAAEAIARGDLLFALYAGELRPPRTSRSGSCPTATSRAAAAPWQREAASIAAHAPGIRCRADVRGAFPLDAGAVGRIAGMHVWSDGYLSDRIDAGEQLHAVVVRAWAAPEGPPADNGARPADDDLLPALTDSAFALLVGRLEDALRG